MEDDVDTGGNVVNQSGILATVPFEEFLEIDGGATLEEDGDGEGGNFTWKGFTEHQNSIGQMIGYLKGSGKTRLGKGSSRVVYALGRGDVGKLVGGPCVLKASINRKGIAQNEAETHLLERYAGQGLECFPRIYAVDRNRWFYMLAEVGTPLNKAPASFVNGQIKKLGSYFTDYISRAGFPDEDDLELLDEDYFNVETKSEFIGLMSDLIMAGDEWEVTEIEEDWLKNMVSDMGRPNRHPMVRAIGHVLKYSAEHGSGEVQLADFEQDANWAFVKRGNSFVLLPIDWGASPEVMRLYI